MSLSKTLNVIFAQEIPGVYKERLRAGGIIDGPAIVSGLNQHPSETPFKCSTLNLI